jgi:dipicolinate synthase subunit A
MMARAFCVEINDKRDYYLAKAIEKEGFALFSMGEEEKYKDFQKVYVRSLLTEVTIEIAQSLEAGSILFSRGISDKVKSILDDKNISFYNLLHEETFIVKNAYLTAEGALGHIIFNTETSLRQISALVLGYGRVGKSLTKILKDNYAYCAVATDDETEFSIATIVADEVYNLSNYKEKLDDFSVIINTIPKKILEGEALKLINKDCFILDLASKPGGVDFDQAKKLQLKFLHALGVPGKVAPKTAGLYIKEIIMKVLGK